MAVEVTLMIASFGSRNFGSGTVSIWTFRFPCPREGSHRFPLPGW